MNAEDLARLLKSANITINIQTGSGTMYTGPVQINHHAASERRAGWTCNKCGFSSDQRHLFNVYFGGGARCWKCERQEIAERKAKQERVWRIVNSRPNQTPIEREPEPLALPEPEPEPAFDVQAYYRELAERYADDDRERAENAIQHAENERRWINSRR